MDPRQFVPETLWNQCRSILGVAIPGSRSRLSISPLYGVHTFSQHDRSQIAGRGAKRGGGDRQRVPNAVLGRHKDPINRLTYPAVSRPKQPGKGYRGSTTGEAQWPIGPRTTGRGIAVPPALPPPRRTMLREDGRAKRWAAAGSPAPRALVKTQACSATWGRDQRPPTGPGTLSMGGHRTAVGRAQAIGRHLSDLSCFLQRQTEAAAFALPGRCRVISAWRQKHLPPQSPNT